MPASAWMLPPPYRSHRGWPPDGFCYGLNGGFAALLRDLGFAVTLLQARFLGEGGRLGIPYDISPCAWRRRSPPAGGRPTSASATTAVTRSPSASVATSRTRAVASRVAEARAR
jgi:hypothetical protein